MRIGEAKTPGAFNAENDATTSADLWASWVFVNAFGDWEAEGERVEDD
jgi:hypothetical protein